MQSSLPLSPESAGRIWSFSSIVYLVPVISIVKVGTVALQLTQYLSASVLNLAFGKNLELYALAMLEGT